MTTRRDFLKTAAIGSAAVLSAGCPGSAASQKRRRPNLLFIWTDEQRPDTMGAYGNAKIRTPNLNRLGQESFVFERAYVTQPVCTPSRSSVMTGLWPHQSGLETNNLPLPQKVPCFPEILNDPGYATAYMGKWHLGDEVFRQRGFDEWVSIEDNYIGYYSRERDKTKRSDYHQFLIGRGYKPDNPDQNTFSRTFCTTLPVEHCKPKFLEEKACDFLKRHRNGSFILYVNFLEPHMPFNGPLDRMYDPKDVDFPASFSKPFGENDPLRCRARRVDDRKGYGSTEREFRELIARYWGLVTQVDMSVGGILDTLDKLGLKDDTIVVYTSDHGDMMAAHGMVAKSVMYEEAIRIPWLVRVPWMGLTQKRIKDPVSQIDTVPTLLDLMSVKSGKAFPGQSLVPLMRGGKVKEDCVFIEWNTGRRKKSGKAETGNFNPDLLKALRTAPETLQQALDSEIRTVVSPDGWKLCLAAGDKSQLFNLNGDPGETNNLYYSGKHRDVIERLTSRIHKWQKKVADTLTV